MCSCAFSSLLWLLHNSRRRAQERQSSVKLGPELLGLTCHAQKVYSSLQKRQKLFYLTAKDDAAQHQAQIDALQTYAASVMVSNVVSQQRAEGAEALRAALQQRTEDAEAANATLTGLDQATPNACSRGHMTTGLVSSPVQKQAEWDGYIDDDGEPVYVQLQRQGHQGRTDRILAGNPQGAAIRPARPVC
ncbi:hypothetical protein WJX79_010562 [Trebouxia sp. C0005]